MLGMLKPTRETTRDWEWKCPHTAATARFRIALNIGMVIIIALCIGLAALVLPKMGIGVVAACLMFVAAFFRGCKQDEMATKLATWWLGQPR